MYSFDLKLRVINFYNSGNSILHTSRIFQISKSTIHRWINLDHTNITKTYSRHLNHSKITSPITSFILKLIVDNPFITASKIKYYLYKLLDFSISTTSIYKIIKNNHFTHKKISKQLFYKSLDDIYSQQSIFQSKVKNINMDDIICIDESYISYDIISNYGWNKSNSRLIIPCKITNKKYSLIMAISNKRIISYQLYKSSIDGNLYFDFISSFINNYKNKYFLMDNARIHHTIKIKSLIESNNKLLFIPPYSPKFNAIENAFSKIKSTFRSLKIFYDDIYQLLDKSISKITVSDLFGFYNHAYR